MSKLIEEKESRCIGMVKGCPAYMESGKCRDSYFNCSDIALCTTKQIVIECLSVTESNNTGNEAWLLASIILSELGVKE